MNNDTMDLIIVLSSGFAILITTMIECAKRIVIAINSLTVFTMMAKSKEDR